jgi:hypothetical protein
MALPGRTAPLNCSGARSQTLSPEELQIRIDAQLLDRATWLGAIAGCLYVYDAVNYFRQPSWYLALVLGAFAGAMSVACFAASIAALRSHST